MCHVVSLVSAEFSPCFPVFLCLLFPVADKRFTRTSSLCHVRMVAAGGKQSQLPGPAYKESELSALCLVGLHLK